MAVAFTSLFIAIGASVAVAQDGSCNNFYNCTDLVDAAFTAAGGYDNVSCVAPSVPSSQVRTPLACAHYMQRCLACKLRLQ